MDFNRICMDAWNLNGLNGIRMDLKGISMDLNGFAWNLNGFEWT